MPPRGKEPTTADTNDVAPVDAAINAVSQTLADASQQDSTEVRVLMFGRDPNGWRIEKLKMVAGLAAKFGDTLRSVAAAHAEDLVVAYSAGRATSPGEIAALPITDVPELGSLVATMQGDVDLADYTPTGPLARTLAFYVVSVHLSNGGWVHGLRAKSGTSLRPTRRKGVIPALFTNGLFTELAEDPLLFDRSFDALIGHDAAGLIHQRAFERALDFLAQARAEADTVLRTMTKNLPLANMDEFLGAATSDINMLSKVRGIAAKLKKNPKYAAAMTMPNLVQFAKAHPQLAFDIEGDPGDEKLVFHPDPQRRWRILKLLDDDYLHSQLTNLDYEANSKDFL